MPVFLFGALSTFVIAGCAANSAKDTYLEAMDTKNEGDAYHLGASADVETPEAIDSEMASTLALSLDNFNFAFEIRGEHDGESYEIEQDFPGSALTTYEPYPIHIENGVLDDTTYYQPVESMIDFFNETGAYGFEVQLSEEIEGMHIELPFETGEHSFDDFFHEDEEFLELVSDLDDDRFEENDGEISFSLEGEEARPYLEKKFFAFSQVALPGSEQLYDLENGDEQMSVGEVEIRASLTEDGVLSAEEYVIPIEENGREWLAELRLDYYDLDYDGEILMVEDIDPLTEEDFNDYMMEEQQRDLGELIDEMDEMEDE
ncbi:hypothetical protein HUG15_15960 [Salicibibacter cibarius]|uniref:Uncharacterized protein n=2 Tax=Salicibibacter cibarius TaxID=2743000 RepID=A0A7T6Z4U9_9BACI|nr:hypothetical protein HUG15_15960 [Salicibibacter cibarius]